MTVAALGPLQRVTIGMVRGAQALGISGCFGVALWAAAFGVLGMARSILPLAAEPPASMPEGLDPLGPRAEAPIQSLPVARLRHESDSNAVVAELAELASRQGLGWSRGDYRWSAATAEWPGALEITTSFTAPYLPIRRFLDSVVQKMAGASVKAVQFRRSSPESPQLDAKLVLVIFMDPEHTAADAPSTSAAMAAPAAVNAVRAASVAAAQKVRPTVGKTTAPAGGAP